MPLSNNEWKHDADYIRYVKSGESAAVFVVRDVVKAVDTTGKWIDILSFSTYFQDEDEREFNWIVAEIFPRKLQPEYDPDNSAHNRYLTWKTANEDIALQRDEGYVGPKYLILCNLHDKNKGKTITYKLVKITKKYRADDGDVIVVERMAKKPETITKPCPHDWEYRIHFLKRLNGSQADFIREHSRELEDKILAQGKSSPEIFGFKSSKGEIPVIHQSIRTR